MMKRLLSDTAIKVLSESGWKEDRNVISDLVLPEGKSIFPQMEKTIGKFALLRLEYYGRSGKEVLYFDTDDSITSQNLRAEMWGYKDVDEAENSGDFDFEKLENLGSTKEVEGEIKSKCIRVGFLENDLGYEIYIDENFHIYLDHGGHPFLASLNFYDFINSLILSPLEI